MSIGTEWPIFAIDISQKIVHNRKCFLVRLAISFYSMEYLQTEPLLLKYYKTQGAKATGISSGALTY